MGPVLYVFLFFFFSSRRRHTRLQGDWSSDVCSSDLGRVSAHGRARRCGIRRQRDAASHSAPLQADRKSTRLNSSHLVISYAVFCLKKKKYCGFPSLILTPISLTFASESQLF